MKTKTKLILAVIVILEASVAAVYGYKWYKSDTSGEAGYTIFSAVAIPLTIFGFKYFLGSQEKDVFTVAITSAAIRCFSRDVDYGFQFSFDVRTNMKATIKDVKMWVPDIYGYGGKDGFREIIKFKTVKQTREDLLSFDLQTFQKRLDLIVSTEMNEMIIDRECRYFTVVGHVLGERLPDGYEGLPDKGWKLQISYNGDQCKEVPIDFSIHEKSCSEPSTFRFTGFSRRA